MANTDLVARLRGGDRRALARVVTLIENGAPETRTILAELHAHGGRAHIVGFTRSPRAGKSTPVTQLARQLRKRNLRLALVAVDPTNPFTRGAIPGDPIPMPGLARDP